MAIFNVLRRQAIPWLEVVNGCKHRGDPSDRSKPGSNSSSAFCGWTTGAGSGGYRPSYPQNLTVIAILSIDPPHQCMHRTRSMVVPFFTGHRELADLLVGVADCAADPQCYRKQNVQTGMWTETVPRDG